MIFAKPEVQLVFLAMFVALVAATALGLWLKRTRPGPFVDNLNARVKSWWAITAVGAIALAGGPVAISVLFAALSLAALKEFLGPAGGLKDLFIGLLIVAGVAHVPALLMLRFDDSTAPELLGLFVVLVAQISDIMQYVWGNVAGRHKIAPRLSPSKTVEGTTGGILSATAFGALLAPITPFTPGEAALTSLAICIAGFAGGLILSGVKRRRGLKDWGSSIPGHGGILDRLDSLWLSAPVFFYLVRYGFLIQF